MFSINKIKELETSLIDYSKLYNNYIDVMDDLFYILFFIFLFLIFIHLIINFEESNISIKSSFIFILTFQFIFLHPKFIYFLFYEFNKYVYIMIAIFLIVIYCLWVYCTPNKVFIFGKEVNNSFVKKTLMILNMIIVFGLSSYIYEEQDSLRKKIDNAKENIESIEFVSYIQETVINNGEDYIFKPSNFEFLNEKPTDYGYMEVSLLINDKINKNQNILIGYNENLESNTLYKVNIDFSKKYKDIDENMFNTNPYFNNRKINILDNGEMYGIKINTFNLNNVDYYYNIKIQ